MVGVQIVPNALRSNCVKCRKEANNLNETVNKAVIKKKVQKYLKVERGSTEWKSVQKHFSGLRIEADLATETHKPAC
jgi:hypothetical protein